MKLLEIFGDRVKTNELMSKHTTYRIGGSADFYLEVDNADEVKTALLVAKDDGLPVFILGGGSNILVSDDGIRGLVIAPALRKMEINDKRVYAEAGVVSALFARLVSEAGFAGLEWAAGLPGTIGGAIRGNAGGYGSAMGNAVLSVDAVDLRDGCEVNLPKDQCGFAYRESIFKKEPYFILGASFSLKAGDKNALMGRMNEIIAARGDKIPLGVGSAGSVFKNHYFDSPEELSERVRVALPPEYLASKKIPAVWLIQTLGLKGKMIGKAQVSPKHANFFVNTGGATASEVHELIAYAKMKVLDEYGIQLQEEIQYVGF
jgi:UDP-N-acetylmuramate dehydrogenase